ncbi:hypothetical protein EB809_01530 [Marinobacter sp. R17]|uniref:SpoIIE family protein phosphatase n=1 Tax=Marinobacter sp. R17 TaxID=2484250 RepID=UPI000F4C0F2D|nr:hypothetical protein EB809_01530 [Marinobacter sp. R17]
MTEAFKGNHDEFGEDRLLTVADSAPHAGMALMATRLEAVAEFAGDAPQSDDMTVLTLKRT